MKRLFLITLLAVLKLVILLTPVEGGEFRRLRKTTRITVLRPVKAQARAAAGYPFLSAMFHTAKSVDNVTANLRIGRIIGDILFTPFRR